MRSALLPLPILPTLYHQRPLAATFPCRARGAPLYDSDFEEMYGSSAGAPLLGGTGSEAGVDEAREEVEATFGHAFHSEQPGALRHGARGWCWEVCVAACL